MKHILSIENIKLGSINEKYAWNKKLGRLILSDTYRDFKNLIILKAVRGQIKAPYKVMIKAETYRDIDNFIKPLHDGLEVAGIISNDRYILEEHIYKTPIKRGRPNKIDVWIETIEND